MMGIFRSMMGRRRFRSYAFGKDELQISLKKSVVLIVILVLLHSVVMAQFEGISFGQGIWLSLTTITTVGYGDISAETVEGRAATVLLLYLGGIFLLAKVAGDYFEYRAGRRDRQRCGNWEWNMSEHILIINTPRENGEWFCSKIIEQIRENELYQDSTVEILTQRYADGLPPALAEMEGVVHRNRDVLDDDELKIAGADKAAAIVILAREEHNVESDSRTFDILHRLKEIGVEGVPVLAECVNDRNRERFLQAGATVVIRPVRSYPEMLVRGLVAPGSEQVIENMFTSEADEYIRYDLNIGASWKDVVSTVIQNDFGIAVAYMDRDTGCVVTNPRANTQIDASALFIMVNEGMKPSIDEVGQVLVAI